MSTEIAAAGLKDTEYKQAAANQAAQTLFRSDNPKEQGIALGIKNLFGNTNGFQSESLTDDLYRRLKVQFGNLIATDPDKGAMLEEGLKPVSSFIGSTLLNLTGLQEDPLGSKFDLPQTLSSMLEKMNPEIHAKFKGTYESFNAQKLGELPTQLFGNAKQLTETPSTSGTNNAGSAAKGNTSKVSLPMGLQDSYRGLEDLMGKANDFISNATETIQKELTKLTKNLPKEVTGLLGNAGQFSGQIEGLTKQFGNIEQLQSLTSKLNIGTLDFNSLLSQNPLNALQSLGGSFGLGEIGDIGQLNTLLSQNPLQNFMQGGLPSIGGLLDKPSSIPQGPNDTGSIPLTGGKPPSTSSFSLPDPKAALKSFLPSQISGALGQIGSIPGFGFTGNMPFGLSTALQGIGGDVLGGILNKFSGQLPFLASTLLGTAGPNDAPDNYPSNEASTSQTPDGSTTYITDKTSGAIIRNTPPKPVYGATGPAL